MSCESFLDVSMLCLQCKKRNGARMTPKTAHALAVGSVCMLLAGAALGSTPQRSGSDSLTPSRKATPARPGPAGQEGRRERADGR